MVRCESKTVLLVVNKSTRTLETIKNIVPPMHSWFEGRQQWWYNTSIFSWRWTVVKPSKNVIANLEHGLWEGNCMTRKSVQRASSASSYQLEKTSDHWVAWTKFNSREYVCWLSKQWSRKTSGNRGKRSITRSGLILLGIMGSRDEVARYSTIPSCDFVYHGG